MFSLKICIIGGAGHIGLPLGISLANAGFNTTLLDKNLVFINKINKGEPPYIEINMEEALKQALERKTLRTETMPEKISEADVLIFALWLDVDGDKTHILKNFLSNLDQFLKYFRDGQVLIFRSTLFPGALNEVANYLKDKGLNLSLAYCPERMSQGQGLSELVTLPQLVSALDVKSLEVVQYIFSKISPLEIKVLKPIEAELGKLFCNAYRYINFAISNEFLKISEENGADFNKIYQAITDNYPRMKSLPTAGLAAGPCLVKDTKALTKIFDNRHSLCEHAIRINEESPLVIVRKLKNILGDNLSKKNIAILGMTFKANIDDVRCSLSFKLKEILELELANVYCHDPYLNSQDFPNLNFINLDEVMKMDGCILGVPHQQYKNLPFVHKAKIIDVWGFVSGK